MRVIKIRGIFPGLRFFFGEMKAIAMFVRSNNFSARLANADF